MRDGYLGVIHSKLYPQKKYEICAIGNALVDIIAKVSVNFLENLLEGHSLNYGGMTLVNQEDQEKLYKKILTHNISTQKVAGGSAANTVWTFQIHQPFQNSHLSTRTYTKSLFFVMLHKMI